MAYVPPERGERSFTCPHCGVLAQQNIYSNPSSLNMAGGYISSNPIATAVCTHCGKFSLWVGQALLYPDRGSAPIPNADMPDDVLADYEEAARVASASPKAAAALLRLAIQKLCVHLGGDGKNINSDIAKLVKNGLSPMIQQSLDVVRVVGNNAVHPGQIDVDNPEVVGSLFALVNLIVESMISTPMKVSKLYSALPGAALDGIAKRDGDASG